ncbi:MAG: glycosyltransferase, partial [Patescibacteria group bacterium]
SRAHALAMYDCRPLIGRQIEHYRRLAPWVKKVAFVLGPFPVVSETFIINQIADLIDQGLDVRIYAFNKFGEANISDRYFQYKMAERTTYLELPSNIFLRVDKAIPKFLHVLLRRPKALGIIFDFKKYGLSGLSLKPLFWVEPFIGLKADVVHCHFGRTANRYLFIRRALGLPQPFITTFYGFDISNLVQVKGPRYYDDLIREGTDFLVMSNNMKERVAAIGFSPDRMDVLPISEDIESFVFKERTLGDNEVTRLVSVGRFVEKKGFDDVIKAMKIVKEKYQRPFICSIIGGGELEDELRALAKTEGVEDVVKFEGFMKVQDVTKFLLKSHLYIQGSKTAANGDME